MATITFFGAAAGVTGSKHLLETNQQKILLDCGTFQGLPDTRERNRSVPFAPESISMVIISHAHLDHIGMLPILVKRGFTGPIYCTPATRDLMRHMLEDTASIEVQDADYRRRHHLGAPDDREPLFTLEDIAPIMKQVKVIPYARHTPGFNQLTDTIALKFYDAGHILGSAVTVLKITEGTATHTLAYSGDLGPTELPLLHHPEIPTEPIDALILESTYGSRRHEPLKIAIDRLATAITTVYKRQGKMIIPAFSLGRTQLLVYVIHKLTDEGRIPRFPIYVDSPLATDITEVFTAHAHEYDDETYQDFSRRGDLPLAFRNLTYTNSVDQSKALNTTPGPYLVISASGMMTAGRVIHHLRHSISDPTNAIFITGYQAAGTLGRRLVEGANMVELHGEQFPVRAEVLVFNEFSAHADRDQLQTYAQSLTNCRQVMLVHGEPHHADDLKQQLMAAHPDWSVTRPNEGDTVTVW